MNGEQAIVILQQLSRRNNPMNSLKALIGASNFSVGSDVRFAFKMFRKANICSIELDESLDLYNMKFSKFNRKTYTFDIVKSFSGVYADQLTELFENFTGLTLHCPRVFIGC
jgi:hypothetical protein